MAGESARSTDVELQILYLDQCDPDQLRADWNRIVCQQSRSNLFITPLWVINYWRFRNRGCRNLQLLFGRTRDGTPVGLVPLVRERGLLGTVLPTLRAVHSTGEYESDWICAIGWAHAFVTAVCDYLIRKEREWFQLRMSAVRDGSPIIKALRDECERRGLKYRLTPGMNIPFVLTDGSGPSLEELVNGRYRRSLRRRRRLLEKLGSLHFEDYTDEEHLAERFEEFLRVEAASWKGRRGTAIRCQPDAKRFWWHLIQEAARQGALRLHLLRLDDRTISGEIGLLWGGRYYCLKVGYDESYRQYGPGALMTQHVLEYCFNDPDINVYDFAGPARPYMWNWADRHDRTWHISVGTPAPVRGKIYAWSLRGRAMVRQIRSAIRPPSKHRDGGIREPRQV